MKTRLITPVVLALGLLLSVSACRSNRIINKPVVINPGHKGMPPGQAKKVYGHQSARAFAPGQQKKNGFGKVQAPKGNKAPKGKGKGKY